MFDELLQNLQAIEDEIQSKVKPENIKKGLTLFSVEGVLNGEVPQIKEVQPSTVKQIITPTGDATALSEVVVEAVTKDIDSDIQASNIRADVTILGVEGTLSSMTNTDYRTALEATSQILGDTKYVVGKRLVDNDATITDNVLTVDGTVEDGVLILN